MAGLHDIAPIVSKRCVTSAVDAPRRAEAAAASQPACPPPMTITSKLFISLIRPTPRGPIYGLVLAKETTESALFADAQPRKNRRQHVFDIDSSGDSLQRARRQAQVLG